MFPMCSCLCHPRLCVYQLLSYPLYFNKRCIEQLLSCGSDLTFSLVCVRVAAGFVKQAEVGIQ